MSRMNVQDLTILIHNHNMRRKSFEKFKMCGVSFIRWNKNGKIKISIRGLCILF